jgi:hypothetical protein
MVGSFLRLAAAVAFSCTLTACASTPDYNSSYAAPRVRQAAVTPQTGVAEPSKPLQCVPYARNHSGINIFGDAYTWWDKSEGQYAHRQTPLPGAVMMLTGYAGPNRAHLAVVRAMVSAREIRIDHANWFNDGSIYTDDPVMDVSEDNDWSEVRVWNIRSQSWGTRTYLVRGFIGPGRGDSENPDNDEHGGSGDLVSVN